MFMLKLTEQRCSMIYVCQFYLSLYLFGHWLFINLMDSKTHFIPQ